MDDAMAMRILQRARNMLRDSDCLVYRQLPLARQAIAKRFALDERHDVEQTSARFARIVQWQDMRMVQSRGDLNLTKKALCPESSTKLRLEDLDRDRATMADVIRLVDGGHPA